jgi:lipopolysaccharide heptosyltransferase II
MHVLQLLPSLDVGGVERGVVDLASGLIARGHRVSVISSGGALVERLTRLGAAHYHLPIHRKSPAVVLAAIPQVARLIRATGVDLVHARSRVPALIGRVAARRAQRPFLTTAHGFYRPHLASRVMVAGRLVIVPSQALGDYLVTQFGLSRDRLRVIPRGVDLEEFAFQPPTADPAGPWRIGLFSRLSPIKGHEVALRACAHLIRRGIPVRLYLAGSPQRAALEALASQLDIAGAVEWLGVRQDIPDLIASVDCVVVPSTYPESFGRSVIEAQAVGRPVVASRLGGLTEVIEDGQTGLLVPPGDSAALADALERFIQDPALRQRCVAEGRARVEARWSATRMVEETLRVYEECLTKPRILVWKLGALGDVLLATPSLRALRRQYPHARLTLAVGRAAYELVARCPHLDDLIIYDPARKDRGLRRLAFIRRLRQGGFDWSVDLQNSRATHLLAWLAGIPLRIGYRRKLGWLLNRPVRLPRVVMTPIAHQQHLLRSAGFAPDGNALELWPSALDEAAADRLLNAATPAAGLRLVGLHPGGSGRWRTKRWDLPRWATLCDALAARQARIVIVGGPEERGLAEALTGLTRAVLIDAVGKTSLLELACLIKRCDVFVAHDSSSLHVAAAVGTPTVALFGPTDPRRHLPPTFRGQVIEKAVFCRPCYARRCRTITHACMARITPEEVLGAVLTLLAEAPLPAGAP